jgi:hypothetical protein
LLWHFRLYPMVQPREWWFCQSTFSRRSASVITKEYDHIFYAFSTVTHSSYFWIVHDWLAIYKNAKTRATMRSSTRSNWCFHQHFDSISATFNQPTLTCGSYNRGWNRNRLIPYKWNYQCYHTGSALHAVAKIHNTSNKVGTFYA